MKAEVLKLEDTTKKEKAEELFRYFVRKREKHK